MCAKEGFENEDVNGPKGIAAELTYGELEVELQKGESPRQRSGVYLDETKESPLHQ